MKYDIKKNIKRIFKNIAKKNRIYLSYKKHKVDNYLRSLKIEEDKNVNSKNNIIRVLNLNANDICNSKCAMCNIWEQKKDFEISPKELHRILKNPLFENIEHIGITGGEPTLREDLPELFEEIIKALPNIIGLSTITNCIQEKDVIERIEKSIDVCNDYGKEFSMMISVDGYGDVHDKIRGRKGNFKSAMLVYEHFRKKGVNISTGSTISKINVWEIDELLDFFKENNIYGRFRIAEFINRLYNNNKSDIIRNFDADETYNLILFFYKLIYSGYEKNETYIRTYKSIINVLSGGKRLIGCPYQNNGLVLNSKGEMAYCAPKSAIIGNSLKDNAFDVYNENLEEKDRIKNENCSDCIHDYHAPITYNELKLKVEEDYWKKYINLNNIHLKKIHKKIIAKKKFENQVFITGWYGTETVGDKAILAGIISELKEKNKDIGFIVTSLFVPITSRTISELGFNNVIVIPVYSIEFIEYLKGSDTIIMGGGPLMDLDELALPLISFKIGKYYNKTNIVFGCGIGPLYIKKNKKAVKDIISLADEIMLRDENSRKEVLKWTNNSKEIKLISDPAKKYIISIANSSEITPIKSTIMKCFLREWTPEYCRELSTENFLKKKKELELSLSNYIKMKATEIGATEIYLDHMHNFVVGMDDRDFSRYFIKNYFNDFKIPINYNKKLSTVKTIVNSMSNSAHNVCMRFHSVVFADTLNTDYTAFDYTGGGKILGYLTDNSKKENLLTIEELLVKY
jgi:MoaA/NifB/PqqE/SkfB family radical SAM enzyme/polysaccharide pyruvyl transferase WcaK-like protein